MKQIHIIGVFFWCLAQSAFAQSLETWESESGIKIQAAFSEIDEDAKTVTILIPKAIKFDKLSPKSIALAKRLAAQKNTPVEMDDLDANVESGGLPIDPAELKGDAKAVAYIFALHDLNYDKALVTNSATQPYANKIAMLMSAYGLTGEEIGNAILAATEVMKESDVDYNFLNILDALLKLDVLENAKLSELLATYSVFRSKGETHDDTVSQLHALLKAIKDKRTELQDEVEQQANPNG